MSAAAPVVTRQLGPGEECERCANQNFPEQKPAVAITNGIAVCRRCDNLFRAQAEARRVPVTESYDDLSANFVPAGPIPAPTAPAPRILSKQEYLDQFGPASNDDLARMVQSLKPGHVLILPFIACESAGHAKRACPKAYPSC